MLYSRTSDQHFHLLLRQEKSRLCEKQERERERGGEKIIVKDNMSYRTELLQVVRSVFIKR